MDKALNGFSGRKESSEHPAKDSERKERDGSA